MKKLLYFSVVFFTIFYMNSNDINEPIKNPTHWLSSREEMLDILPKNGTVAEIGVSNGPFSEVILQMSNPEKLYLIDCWEIQPIKTYPEGGAWYAGVYQAVVNKFAGNKKVKIVKDFSVNAAKTFPDHSFDWVFIDANHTYEAVRADLEAWLPKIKKGGYLCGHDYCHYAYYGVIRAVNEFLIEHGLSMLYLTQEPFPSYVIRIN